MHVISESDYIAIPKSNRSPVTRKNTARGGKLNSKMLSNSNVAADDISSYESVMNKTYDNGLKIRDIVSIIDQC